METAFKTDCGQIRDHNEDSGGIFTNQTDLVLAVVADGMGGHRAGDIASSLALDYVKEKWKKAKPEQIQTEEASQKWLSETIHEANTYVFTYAEQHPDCKGMGTTIVLAICSRQFLTIAHVGDSRGYMLAKEEFVQVTKDQSLVNELVRQGQITEEEAAFHPRKNVILQSLGTDNKVESETVSHPWNLEDIVLLCSDGLTDNVSREQLEFVMRSGSSVPEKAEELIQLANFAGGNDNITLTLVKLTEEKEKIEEISSVAADVKNGKDSNDSNEGKQANDRK